MSPKQMLKGKDWTGYSDGEEGRLPAQTQDQADPSSCCASASSPPASTSTARLQSGGQKEVQANTSKKTKESKSAEKDTEDHYFKGDVADLAKQPEVGEHFQSQQQHWEQPQSGWWPQYQCQFVCVQMCPPQQLQCQWQVPCDMGSAPHGTWNETPAQCQPKQRKPRKLNDYARVTPEDRKVLEQAKCIRVGNTRFEGDQVHRVSADLLNGSEMSRSKKSQEISEMSRQKQLQALNETRNGWLWKPASSDFKFDRDGNVVISVSSRGSLASQAAMLGFKNSDYEDLRALRHELVTEFILNCRDLLNGTGIHALCRAVELAETTEQIQPIVQNMEELVNSKFGARVVIKATKSPANSEIGKLLAGKVLSISQRAPALVFKRDFMLSLENITTTLVVKPAELEPTTKKRWADLADDEREEKEVWSKLWELFTCLSDDELYKMVVHNEELVAITNLLKGENCDCKSQLKKRLIHDCNCLPMLWEKRGTSSKPRGVAKKALDLIRVLQ